MAGKITVEDIVKRVIAICNITIEGERPRQQCENIVDKFPDEALFKALNELQEICDKTTIEEVIKKMKQYYEAVTESEFLVNLYTKDKAENSAVKLMLGLQKQNSQAEIFYKVYKNSKIKENDKEEKYRKEINKANKERKNEIPYAEGDYSKFKISFEDAYKSVYKFLENSDQNYANCKKLLENSKGNGEHVDVDFIDEITGKLRKFYNFWSNSVEKATNRMKTFEKEWIEEEYSGKPLIESAESQKSVFQNSSAVRSYYWREYKLPGDSSPFSLSFFIQKGDNDTFQYKVAFEIKTRDVAEKDKKRYNDFINTKEKDHKKDVESEELKNGKRKRYTPYWVKVDNNMSVNEEEIKNAMESIMETYNNFARCSKIFEIIDGEIEAGNKQIILTGAPGTGKTQGVKDYAKSQNAVCKMVQFHPSYDYSDFVEGIRPVNVGEGADTKMIYVKLDGQFKKFCRERVEENIKEFIKENYDVVKDVLCESSKTAEELCESSKADIVDKWYELLKNGPYNEDESKFNNETVFLNKITEANNNIAPAFFIIDEVNRADIAKVFGELMYGLEYRGVGNRFDTQYQNLKTYDVDGGKYMEDDVFKNGFFVPENVIIIGTMNDIDRSVESFDLAMRRRFQWPKVTANDVMSYVLKSILYEKNVNSDQIEDLVNNITKMNNIISEKPSLSEDYQIGPGYFKMLGVQNKKIDEKSLKNIFDKKIDPLLREYVRGRRSMSSKDVDEFVKSCRNALIPKQNSQPGKKAKSSSQAAPGSEETPGTDAVSDDK